MRVILALTLISGLIIAGNVTPARADTRTITDGNDTTGALDLASVTVSHKGGVVYTFKTFKAFTATTLAPHSYFLAAFDRNDDGSADRCAFIYESGSRFAGELTNCGSRYLDALAVRHPSSRTATITVPTDTFAGTYRWRAFSFYQQRPNCGTNKGCVDVVPNRSIVVHDLTPPTATWVTTQPSSKLSTALSNTMSVPVEFMLSDDRGVDSWEVRRSTSPLNTSWETVATGTGGGDVHTDLDLQEGETYTLKVFAYDRAGNVGSTPTLLHFAVPIDDANAAMQYAGAWSTAPDAGAFQGAHAVSATVDSTMTVTLDIPNSGADVHIVGGPGDGTADLCVLGSCEALSETPATPEMSLLSPGLYDGAGGHQETITVKVTSGTFIVDGVALVPIS